LENTGTPLREQNRMDRLERRQAAAELLARAVRRRAAVRRQSRDSSESVARAVDLAPEIRQRCALASASILRENILASVQKRKRDRKRHRADQVVTTLGYRHAAERLGGSPRLCFAPKVRALGVTLAGRFARRLPPCGWNRRQSLAARTSVRWCQFQSELSALFQLQGCGFGNR